MIELLLAVQTIATAALAVFVIILRRELYPAIATAGPADQVLTPLLRVFIRSMNVLVVETPQFEVSFTVTRVRWLLSEELFLKYSIRVYDVAMYPVYRHHYVRWKAWLNGDDRYVCEVERPRGLARIYSKAIDIFCKEKKEEPPKEAMRLPSWVRKRRYKRWRKPEPGGSAPS